MQNSVFILGSILVVVSLIYFVYNMMLGGDSSQRNEELQVTSSEILAQSKELYKQKKYIIVEKMTQRYLENRYSDVEVRTILAKALHDSGRLNDAIEQAKIILKFQPKNYDMKIFIANCFVELSKMTNATVVLQEVLDADENNVVAVKMLAKIYYDTHQKVLALKMYQRLDEFIYSNNEKATNKKKLALLYIDFKNYDLAIDEYRSVLELYPADVEIRKQIISVHRLTSDYEKLIETAEEILSLNSGKENDLWTLKLLIDSFMLVANYDRALEYANILKEHPDSDKTIASEYIAKIHMETGSIDESISILSTLLDEKSGDINLLKTLAKSYEAKHDFELAEETYKKILDEVGAAEITAVHLEMSNLYANWGEYLFEQGDNEACFKKFATAIQYYSENPEIYYLLGIVNQSIMDFNEAIIQYKKAIVLNGENSRYYFAIAECFAAIDSFYEEKRALLQCVKLNANNAQAQYRLGLLFESQHESNSAIEFLQNAIKADDNLIDAKYRLALHFEGKGDVDKSVALYEDILLRHPEHEDALNNLKMLTA